ncbi:Imm3 family immunity protein [Paenibacillus sp. EZ-K15]|uniref:Imm3 family immunity protein n=1 Tax=Paenibacillus sp. EZ-K15 TaxID=2044275 RepID=UPI000BF2B13A|nr:Imm3 family immunity protein [Paenibacillus sp. EZ-K15]
MRAVRFERDCWNTFSENITIKVTLAEILINNGINAQEEISNIIYELKQFNIEDVGQQLTEEEKVDLSWRMAFPLHEEFKQVAYGQIPP